MLPRLATYEEFWPFEAGDRAGSPALSAVRLIWPARFQGLAEPLASVKSGLT